MCSLLTAMLVPMALGILAAAVFYWFVGPTFWVFVGGLGLAVVLTPGLMAAETGVWRRLAAAAGVVDGVGLVWLWAVARSPITLGQWVLCYLVLVAVVAAAAGLCLPLLRAGMRSGAAAAVVVLAAAWLSWPFWLSPHLSGAESEHLVELLSNPHPIMAINVPLRDEGYWLESRAIAYKITALNQDIPYSPPRSIWASVWWHGAIGVAGILAAIAWRPRRLSTAHH